MSETTPNLILPYILPSQAQKHVTHNEAIRALDALVQLSVLARDLSAPPASPAEGDRYILPAASTGAWLGKDKQVAAFQDGAWLFYPPAAGWQAYDVAQAQIVVFDGSAWVPLAGSGGGVSDGDKGDIVVTGSGTAWAIDANAVTNAKLADMPAGTIKGRAAGSAGDAEDLTMAQAKVLLALTAADIASTPTGGIAATNVQAALNELDSEKLSASGGSISGNLTIAGDLTVSGATYRVDATTVTYDDIILLIGGDSAPVSDDAKDRGILFRWHNGASAKLGFFGWDRSAQEFTIVADATETGDVISGAAGTMRANLRADIAGVNAVADATNKFSVASSAILFNNIGNGVQVKVNKAAAADTASFLFQNGFSGRAEIGLTGDDDFHFKVSANGTTFFESLWITAGSGLVTVKNGFRLDPGPADPAAPVDGQLWYNSTLGKFRKRENGVTADMDTVGGGGGAVWGAITGTLSSQTDLQTALDGKLDDSQASAFGLTLLDDADAPAARTTLGLGTAATAASTAFAAAVHTHAIADVTGLQAALDGKQPTLVSGTNIKTVNGNSLLGSGDLAISGGGAALGLHDFWVDYFFTQANAVAGPFIGAAISTGTNTTVPPATALLGYNPNGVFIRSSTTANSGYRYMTSHVAADYFGVLSHKFRARFSPRTAHTNITIRLGFHDTTTNADATDGAYFEMVAGTVVAKTASNSVRTTQGSLALTINEVFTFDIEVNAAGTSARFRIWQGTNTTAIFDQTITTNIPNTSARTFGAGIVPTNSGTTAADMLILYSMGFGTIEGFTRARG